MENKEDCFIPAIAKECYETLKAVEPFKNSIVQHRSVYKTLEEFRISSSQRLTEH
jgi:hypothetical protein